MLPKSNKTKMVVDKRGGKKADSCDPMDQLNPTHSVTLCSHLEMETMRKQPTLSMGLI